MGHITLDLQEMIMPIGCQHHKNAHQATILNCEVKEQRDENIKIIDHFILFKSFKKNGHLLMGFLKSDGFTLLQKIRFQINVFF